jgi:hypothetical protein
MLHRIRVWLAKRELDRAYYVMQQVGGLASIARYAKASTRYYEVKYKESLHV